MNLDLFVDDTCLYAADHKEGYVLRKIQRGLDSGGLVSTLEY
jgi:hypothetical protein